MGFLELIWAYFVNNFLTQPAYFIGFTGHHRLHVDEKTFPRILRRIY